MTAYGNRQRARDGAFTLVELLVVLGVVAVLAAVMFAGLGGADKTVALRSAQATMANALNAARTRALTKGVHVRIMVHDDPANAEHYRRLIAIVENVTSTAQVVAVYELPEHTAVIPHRTRFTDDMRNPGDWTGGFSGNALGSTFLGATTSLAVNGTETETWEYGEVTPNGTVSGSGSIIVAAIRRQPGGALPLIFESPEQVRGMTISGYALARMINDRRAF